MRPREKSAVAHGELGPGYVLVDAVGAPVLIDLEGLMYFDVEWEHVFLGILLGDASRSLWGTLDGRRCGCSTGAFPTARSWRASPSAT
ncbi:hypothetical protein ACFWG5_35005 [Streptomyces hydrogenans]|uniref:hypothetical protein n=1 Tax=Streptomyces hydrogenans TaxID=1873719 RepID=UPI00365C27E4